MRVSILAAGLALLPAAGVRGQATPQAVDSVVRFPFVDASNLEGRPFAVPRDFAGALNLVVLAFTREQQTDVDGWMPTLRGIAATRANVRVYELPVLARRYRLIRRVIDGGMRSGIPDPAVRAATITLFIDKSPFERALGIPNEEQIQILLVDRQGTVRWRAAGRYTETVGGQLATRVASTP